MAYVSIDESNWLQRYGLKNKSNGIRYLYSIYWASNTMLLVGSGSIIPKITEEIALSVITQFFGFFMIINYIIRLFFILKNMEIDDKINNKNMMKLSRFMNLAKISKDLKMRILSFLRFKGKMEKSLISNNIKNQVEFLSTSLQKELYLNAYGHFLKNNSILFRIFSKEFLIEISKSLEQKLYLEGDIIFERHSEKDQAYFFVESGKVELFYLNQALNGHSTLEIIPQNKNFGGFSFITGFNNIYSSKALENTKILQISRENFLEILQKYPEDHEKFCEFRENLIFYSKNQSIDIKCPICNSNNHIIGSCNFSQLAVNRRKAISKFLSSKTQIRNEIDFQRKRQKFNCLKSKKKLFPSAEKNKLLSFHTENSYVTKTIDEEGVIFFESETSEDEDLSPKQRELKFKNSIEEDFGKIANKLNTSEKIKETHKKETRRKPDHFEVDGIKNYEFYFPEQNLEFFIAKANKFRRKKHTTLINVDDLESPFFKANHENYLIE